MYRYSKPHCTQPHRADSYNSSWLGKLYTKILRTYSHETDGRYRNWYRNAAQTLSYWTGGYSTPTVMPGSDILTEVHTQANYTQIYKSSSLRTYQS